MYEVFEHTADLGLRVCAASREELFTEAAQGLFSLIVVNLDAVKPVDPFDFEILGHDLEYLLFDWLNELLYTYESRRVVLRKFELTFTDTGLLAVGRGEPIDARRHQLDHEVKAITYHGLKIARDGEGYLAEVIVDI